MLWWLLPIGFALASTRFTEWRRAALLALLACASLALIGYAMWDKSDLIAINAACGIGLASGILAAQAKGKSRLRWLVLASGTVVPLVWQLGGTMALTIFTLILPGPLVLCIVGGRSLLQERERPRWHGGVLVALGIVGLTAYVVVPLVAFLTLPLWFHPYAD